MSSHPNGRKNGENLTSYAVYRCYVIRQNLRDGHINIIQAHEGLSVYLRLMNISTLDGVPPTVWLLIEDVR